MYTYQEMRIKRASNAHKSVLNIKYFVKIQGSIWMLENTRKINQMIQLQFHIKMF
jgi:virulence-associated protein VapD